MPRCESNQRESIVLNAVCCGRQMGPMGRGSTEVRGGGVHCIASSSAFADAPDVEEAT